ncbi:MAG: cofactor-independent phosphoglycerate mutase [Dehalococcoidia bacterium]|nr:cofactor-independent phosphoglycerate mutase [Dehalococcoidia bacterium]
MKYCVIIIDGASDWPMADHGGRTCLELAHTPNMDAMAREGVVGLVRTVPPGMEPSSAIACMSVLGYDPHEHYRGRSAIEARGMGLSIEEGEVVFRCNLVAVRDGHMWSYSSGAISTEEARPLIASLNEELGDGRIRFYPGVSYRHICKIKEEENAILASCTAPHDIHDKAIEEFLPMGPGSELLRDLMARSERILGEHPVNIARRTRGDIPATMIWLFWGSGKLSDMPSMKEVYGLDAALTSAVDVMRGLARMTGIQTLDIPGVTGDLDNDYSAQAVGALEALERYDLAVIHVEATDEAAHAGLAAEKIEAIQRVDEEIATRLRRWDKDALRVLILPDHSTPVEVQTHVADPVPFVLWGAGSMPASRGRAQRFTEAEARGTGVFIDQGHRIMSKLIAWTRTDGADR